MFTLESPRHKGMSVFPLVLSGTVLLLGLAACMPRSAGSTEGEYKRIVLRPEIERFKCESGVALEVTERAGGGIAVIPDSLDAGHVARVDAWKTLPLYTAPLDGLPKPVEVAPEVLSPPELMLLDGFCCRSWGCEDKYRHIKPLVFAVISVAMMWNSHGVLPSGDYGLLFPTSPPTEARSDVFWALKERQQHNNAVVFFNPLRESIIRVNPPEEKSPGDIYLEPVELTDSQLAEIEPFLAEHNATPSPAFLMTVYGSRREPILRGVLFIQRIGVHNFVVPQCEVGSAPD